MKRKDLVLGQKYIAYNNNKDRYSNYLVQNHNWGQHIVEVVDLRPCKNRGSYWSWQGRTLEDCLENCYTGSEPLPTSISSRYRNVIVKQIDDPQDDDKQYYIVPLSFLRSPYTIWKRKGLLEKLQQDKAQRENEERIKLEESIGRRWNKTVGKPIRNKIKKLEKKAGLIPGSLLATEEGPRQQRPDGWIGPHREEDLISMDGWGKNRTGVVKFKADALLTLLEHI